MSLGSSVSNKWMSQEARDLVTHLIWGAQMNCRKWTWSWSWSWSSHL